MIRKVAVVAGCLALSGSALAAEARWEQDLRQMGYLFLHLSNINVVNGLNLTREQATQLKGLAEDVEAVGAKPPAFDAPIGPELADVRKAWLEMREVLLRGGNPSKELRDRANRAFVAKSKFVRATVRPVPTGRDTRCASCHQAPDASRGLGLRPMTVGPALARRVAAGHTLAVYGSRGAWRLLLVSKKVDALITDGQKEILGSFACCIAPPEDLGNPMRAGQAPTNSKQMALLRKVRSCSDGEWPWVRAAILAYVSPVAEAISPGATSARKAQLRQLVAETIDRTRAMSDVEFEMEKDKLIARVKEAVMPPSGESAVKSAYFLLIPGASEVYARYLARLDEEKARTAN